MEKLYKYTGDVNSYSTEKLSTGYTRMDMIVSDFYDDKKAPTRLQAYGELADYLDALFCSDAEEKYLQKDFWYDNLLTLLYVVIPAARRTYSAYKNVPAKILASTPGFHTTKIVTFGPTEYIKDREPEQMSLDEFNLYLDWRLDNKLFWLNF